MIGWTNVQDRLVKAGMEAFNEGYQLGKAEMEKKIEAILEEIAEEQEKCIASEAHGNSFGLATAREIIRRHINE